MMKYFRDLLLPIFILIGLGDPVCAQDLPFGSFIQTMDIAPGWAQNSVNATIFRKNSITSDHKYQYVAFYDSEGYLTLACRKIKKIGWAVKKTPYQGHVRDAHNSISIMVDGEGFLHVAWEHHDSPLRYARSVAPGSLDLSEEVSMTGLNESHVTYPEFHKLPNGDMLFLYRSGESGNGNLVINRYSTQTKAWQQIQRNLIDGEGQRNAYWQACVDQKGTIHLSWVWRETWDVATNHDLSYARSADGGHTWLRSNGSPYELPVTLTSAEVAYEIPQNHELINQTSMTTDASGNPIIATYWKSPGSDIPQYRVVYQSDGQWIAQTVSDRQTPFSLSGGGTKSIPISRPQIAATLLDDKTVTIVLFRDSERGNRPSAYVNTDFPSGKWDVIDLTEDDLGAWEPSFDNRSWQSDKVLNIFIQRVHQVDGEGLVNAQPKMVRVLSWK